jgi:hypothetical protein
MAATAHPFFFQNGDADPGGGEHQAVVSAIPEGDDARAAQLFDIGLLLPVAALAFENAQYTVDIGKLLADNPEGVGGNDVHIENLGKNVQFLRNAADESAIDGNCSVIIRSKAARPQGGETGNFQFYHAAIRLYLHASSLCY